MKKHNLWKEILSSGLVVLLILPLVSFADDDPPFIPNRLVNSEFNIMKNFAERVSQYTDSCAELPSESKPSPEKLKSCLTTAKKLLSDFKGFENSAKNFMEKAKNADKWSEALDQYFIKSAKKHNYDSNFVNTVNRFGGFRNAYAEMLNQSANLRSELEKEISSLEGLITRSPSSNSDFVKTSFKSSEKLFSRTYRCTIFFLVALAAVASTGGAAAIAVAAGANVAGLNCLTR